MKNILRETQTNTYTNQCVTGIPARQKYSLSRGLLYSIFKTMMNMNFPAKRLLPFFVFALFCSVLSSQGFAASRETTPVSGVRFSADPRIPDEAVSGGVMDAELFIRTALIASGASDGEIPPLLQKLHDAYALAAPQLSGSDDVEVRAGKSLSLLYTVLLSSYSETQTRVDEAIMTGVYNCVSSDILFMYFMKREGIPVVAVETPLHAFCTVSAGGRNIDVETTNPYGFDPGVKKELSSDSSPRKKYVTVPAKNYVNRRNVDDRRIISLIYNNRMSLLQKQKNDYETIGLAVDAMKLQNNSSLSLTTVFQCVYNAAVDCTDKGNDEDGLALAAQAKELFGDSPVYRAYASAAVGNILNRYMKRNDYSGSFAVLEKYRMQLDEGDYRDMYEGTLVNSLNYAVSTQPLAESLALITQNKSALPENEYVKLASFAYSNAAAGIADTGAWLDAASLLERGLQAFPNAGALANQRGIYRRNYAAEVHNKAAQLYNSGDREGALNVVQQGLVQVSDSSILQNDLKRLQQ